MNEGFHLLASENSFPPSGVVTEPSRCFLRSGHHGQGKSASLHAQNLGFTRFYFEQLVEIKKFRIIQFESKISKW